MSCLNKRNNRFETKDEKIPEVIRKCPKCGKKTHFINTKRFRVNANKNRVDVWLIYQCRKCKSTWNMTIYERKNPKKILAEEYERFLANDEDLAKEYGKDKDIHVKNRAELVNV